MQQMLKGLIPIKMDERKRKRAESSVKTDMADNYLPYF
jgi:hypothetical protein